MDTLADVLRRAADRVQFRGWTQGMLARDAAGEGVSPFKPEASEWCALGAFYADFGGWNLSGAHREAYAALTIYAGSIPAWNNAPERTADEVADTMRRCAKVWENGELSHAGLDS